jgi:uncharacterized protein
VPDSPPVILFAHGAGASSASAWMQRWKQKIAGIGRVETFDYPYMAEGRRRPDPLEQLIAAHGRALDERAAPGEPVVLAGKSMGSRVGCHLALERKVSGLVCFGYPLRAQGSGKLRDGVLLELETPILFLSGTRDPLCPLDELERVRGKMKAPSELVRVEGGDHSLQVRKGDLRLRGISEEELEAELVDHVAAFVRRCVSS